MTSTMHLLLVSVIWPEPSAHWWSVWSYLSHAAHHTPTDGQCDLTWAMPPTMRSLMVSVCSSSAQSFACCAALTKASVARFTALPAHWADTKAHNNSQFVKKLTIALYLHYYFIFLYYVLLGFSKSNIKSSDHFQIFIRKYKSHIVDFPSHISLRITANQSTPCPFLSPQSYWHLWLQTTIDFLIHLSYKIDHFHGL